MQSAGSSRLHLIRKIQHGVGPGVVRPFVAIVRKLGEERSRSLAPFIGTILRFGSKKRALDNMKAVLRGNGIPDMQWEALWHAHRLHLGLTILESLHLFWMDNDRLLRQTELHGEGHLQSALEGGRGAVLLVNHCGTLIAAAAALGLRGYNVMFAGNVMPFNSVEQLAQDFYRRVGARRVLLGKGLAFKAASVLHSNGIFAAFCDFTVLKKHNVYVKMGRGEMLVNTGPELIAARNNTPLLALSNERLPNNRHRLKIHPALKHRRRGDLRRDAEDLAQRAIDMLMNDLRRAPEQWWQWYSNRIHAAS